MVSKNKAKKSKKGGKSSSLSNEGHKNSRDKVKVIGNNKNTKKKLKISKHKKDDEYNELYARMKTKPSLVNGNDIEFVPSIMRQADDARFLKSLDEGEIADVKNINNTTMDKNNQLKLNKKVNNIFFQLSNPSDDEEEKDDDSSHKPQNNIDEDDELLYDLAENGEVIVDEIDDL